MRIFVAQIADSMFLEHAAVSGGETVKYSIRVEDLICVYVCYNGFAENMVQGGYECGKFKRFNR
jgi:hypothetical protein